VRNRPGGAAGTTTSQVFPVLSPQATPEGAGHGYFLYLFKLAPGRYSAARRRSLRSADAEGIPSKAHLITAACRCTCTGSRIQSPTVGPSPPGRMAPGGSDLPAPATARRRGGLRSLDHHEHLRAIPETDIAEMAHGIGKVARTT